MCPHPAGSLKKYIKIHITHSSSYLWVTYCDTGCPIPGFEKSISGHRPEDFPPSPGSSPRRWLSRGPLDPSCLALSIHGNGYKENRDSNLK